MGYCVDHSGMNHTTIYIKNYPLHITDTVSGINNFLKCELETDQSIYNHLQMMIRYDRNCDLFWDFDRDISDDAFQLLSIKKNK